MLRGNEISRFCLCFGRFLYNTFLYCCIAKMINRKCWVFQNIKASTCFFELYVICCNLQVIAMYILLFRAARERLKCKINTFFINTLVLLNLNLEHQSHETIYLYFRDTRSSLNWKNNLSSWHYVELSTVNKSVCSALE